MVLKPIHITETGRETLLMAGPVKKNGRGEIRAELIDDEEKWINIAGRWEHLVKIAGAPVYMSFEWLSCWWKHFGKHPKRKLFIITIYRDSELMGIAPFYLGESSIGPVTLQRRLHLMGSGVNRNELLGFVEDYGYSDFLDVIAHPDFKKTVAKYLIAALKKIRTNIDVACLQHISDDSFVNTEMLPRLKKQYQLHHLEQADVCPFLTLPGSMDVYLEELGSSSRRRRFRKNLKPAGKKYSVEEASSPEMVQNGLKLLHKLHQQRWNRLGYPGLFFEDGYFDFLKEITEIAHRKGWLWFKMTRDQEGYSAVRLALKYNSRFYDYASGFDGTSPSSRYRPGLGLLSLMIEDAIRLELSKIEFLRGTERYKFDFTAESRKNWRLTIPLRAESSVFRTGINKLLRGTAIIYYLLGREWVLLRIHFRKAGWLNALFSYASFRFHRLKSKIKQTDFFSDKDGVE